MPDATRPDARSEPASPLAPLPNRWLAWIYGSALMPLALPALVACSLVAYCVVRRRSPEIARSLCWHVSLSFMVSVGLAWAYVLLRAGL